MSERRHVGKTPDHGYARWKDPSLMVIIALPAEGLQIHTPLGCTKPMIQMEFTPDGARAIAKALRKAARDTDVADDR